MSSEDGVVSPIRVILLGIGLVGFGAVGFHEIPGMIAEDAEGTKIINAIYCSIITLTTVGFGDICPANIEGPGRTFIVALAFMGLGMFCGPIMDLAASWKDRTSDKIVLLTFTVTTSVFVFSYLLEEMTESEAAYFSIITGTTIGYGDISPKSDVGKICVALYAILAVNVVATLLEPAKEYLQSFCVVTTTTTAAAETKEQIAQAMKKQSATNSASDTSNQDKETTSDDGNDDDNPDKTKADSDNKSSDSISKKSKKDKKEEATKEKNDQDDYNDDDDDKKESKKDK